MNKLLLATLIATSTSIASADLFKIHGEIGAYMPSEASINDIEHDADTGLNGTFIFEHPLPLIPNARLDTTTIDTAEYELSLSSGTVYYQLTDNGFIDVDAGLGLSYIHNTVINGVDNDDLETPFAHGFVEANIYMPFHPSLSLYANVFKMYGEDEEGHDYKAGIRYSLDLTGFELTATGGFRQMSFEATDGAKNTMSNQGAFFNLGFII